MAADPIKVQIISPCLTFQADAPYSTRMRALAMRSAGLDVEVFAYPKTYPAHVGDLGVAYSSFLEETAAGAAQNAEALKQRWGNYWQFIGEPYHVMRAGCARALTRHCDIVYIADVEPWVTLLLCLRLAREKYPLPLVGQTPGHYLGFLKAPMLRTKIRYGLNYYATRHLPRFMDVLGTSKAILSTLKIDQHSHAHVLPEGHENHLGSLTTQAARAKLGLPCAVRMVLLFGVAGSGKGADILLRALEKMTPEVMVCIVGKTGGVYEASWGDVSKLRQAGWDESKLRIVDRFVTEEEIQNYYAACDAVVIPYRRPFAGTSTHLRRASEHGKAILACDQYHIGERVREYALGLTFRTEDADSLARSLHEFAGKPDNWFAEIAEHSQRLLADESWERVGVLYRALFEKVLQRAGAGDILAKHQLCDKSRQDKSDRSQL